MTRRILIIAAVVLALVIIGKLRSRRLRRHIVAAVDDEKCTGCLR